MPAPPNTWGGVGEGFFKMCSNAEHVMFLISLNRDNQAQTYG